tara:strand:+ start:1532 stop:1822 length:291 start_codon:yes stop_codon:yes gene_type:complete
MEHIYAIKIIHVNGDVDKYSINQQVGDSKIISIKPDRQYQKQFGVDAYNVIAETSEGTKYEFRNFRGFTDITLINQHPDKSQDEMEEMLTLAGHYD